MGVPSLLTRQMAAMDARMICAVVDQHGGASSTRVATPHTICLRASATQQSRTTKRRASQR